MRLGQMMDVTKRPVGESNGVAGLGQMPSFVLTAASGDEVRSSAFRSRRHLVLWLAGAGPGASALSRAAECESAMRTEGAELLVVVKGEVDEAKRLWVETGRRLNVLADRAGELHAALGAQKPMVLVADRNATIYWRTEVEADRADFDEALSWLGYLNILEPECGTCVPAWPVELMRSD